MLLLYALMVIDSPLQVIGRNQLEGRLGPMRSREGEFDMMNRMEI